MKSNEEFIAGIYEKAAVYTEEKETKSSRTVWVAKATRIAATVAVCLGLTGIGSLVLGNGDAVPNQVPQPAAENYGIALTAEQDDNAEGIALTKIMPDAETVTFTGMVEPVTTENNRITVILYDKSIVTIKWDLLEPVREDIKAGVEISATGVLSEYDGHAELVLTDLTDLEVK